MHLFITSALLSNPGFAATPEQMGDAVRVIAAKAQAVAIVPEEARTALSGSVDPQILLRAHRTLDVATCLGQGYAAVRHVTFGGMYPENLEVTMGITIGNQVVFVTMTDTAPFDGAVDQYNSAPKAPISREVLDAEFGRAITCVLSL